MNHPMRLAELVRPTAARWVFLAYAATLSLILYLDRICISQSASSIGDELGMSDWQRGVMFGAFTLGYMLFEVLSGNWGDRYGPKRVLCRIVIGWSLFTALTGCVWRFSLDSGYSLELFGREWPLLFDGFLLLLLVRFLFGAAEAGAYPNLAKGTGRWFPLRERGFAQGMIATVGRVGGGIAAGTTIFVTAFVNQHVWPGMGWRVTFWLFGLLGVAWVVLFARWFHNSPAEHPAVNAAELALIEGREAKVRGHDARAEEGKIEEAIQSLPAKAPAPHPAPHAAHTTEGTPWLTMLSSLNLWAYAGSAFCSAFAVYLYFTWFPAYLRERHKVPEKTWGWVAGLPMICGAVGCMLGGVLTDWLVRRTGSRRWGRRLPGLLGKGGGAVLLLAGACSPNPVVALLLISLSAFMSDLALAAHWSVSTDAGGRFVGTVFGFMNTAAAIGGWLSPMTAGFMLSGFSPRDAAGQFDPALRLWAWDLVLYVYASVLALSGLCWLRIDAEESMVG